LQPAAECEKGKAIAKLSQGFTMKMTLSTHSDGPSQSISVGSSNAMALLSWERLAKAIP
jgi:hypothetical protein